MNITIKELAEALNKMYQTGKERKEVNQMMLLFGIRYSQIIIENQYRLKEIVAASILSESTVYTEIRKGLNLAKYVEIKPEYQ